MNRYWLAIVIATGIPLTSGCDRNEGVMPKVDDSQQQKMAGNEEKKSELSRTEPSQAERDTYLKSAREEIDRLRTGIDALAVKAKESSGELKVKLEARVQGLRDDMRVIEKKWQDLKGVTAAAWQDTKNSLNESIEKLRKALQSEAG